MSMGASDISWQTLRRIVRKWKGDTAEVAEVASMAGGCINTTLSLKSGCGERGVLKISPHRVDRSFCVERYQLEKLRERGLPTPGIYLHHLADLDEPDSYLLLEFMRGMQLDEARKVLSAQEYADVQRDLARLVTRMHETTAEEYKRVSPDGGEAQRNGEQGDRLTTGAGGDGAGGGIRFDRWSQFFHHLYDPIFEHAEHDQHLHSRSRRLIHKIHSHVEKLVDHGDKPRLTHGDLWAHNVLVDKNAETGKWGVSAILDPNCKFSHAENELAYMELFGTVTQDFLAEYRERMGVDGEYARVRKPVYQLYTLLNHLRLFGGAYVGRVERQVEAVAALV
jgi:fructosamine-3-kinase